MLPQKDKGGKILQARILEQVASSLYPGDLLNPGIKLRSPSLQADSLPTEQPGKATNTRGGSLSLLQEISQTQGSNQGFPKCRWILYQLSCQGSPKQVKTIQIRKSKACYSQPPSLAFGRLKGKPKRKNMEKRESYRYNLNGGSCPGEAVV